MKKRDTKQTSVEMAKRGAYLQMRAAGKRATRIPNKKRKAARNFCRGR